MNTDIANKGQRVKDLVSFVDCRAPWSAECSLRDVETIVGTSQELFHVDEFYWRAWHTSSCQAV